MFLGDSITFGRSVTGAANGSYPFQINAFTGHRHFSNPIIAVSGSETSDLITDQLPLASTYYNGSLTSNVASVMIGINDIRDSVAIATIRANLNTIVSDLQTDGYTVVLHTILRDFGTAWADRITLNNEIIAGDFGQDYTVDHTTSDLETDSGLFEVDQLHPNPAGMTQIALNSWLTFNTI